MADDDRHLPGLGNVALLGGGALVALLLARRTRARAHTPASEPRNARAVAVLGSLGAELAVRCVRDAADRALARGLRNQSRLAYRAVGAAGERYPGWVRALRGQSGVYVIRDRATGETLYVGESHAGKLYETLTRHLQRWRRWKSFWREEYAKSESDHDPGVTYERDSVEVAARVLAAEEAIDEEARLIRALKPRDNVNRVDVIDVDDIPF